MSIISGVIISRMGSSRLPGKALKMVADKPILRHIIERVKRSKCINKIVVATPDKKENQPIVELSEELGVYVYKGSDDDVIDRVVKAGRSVDADIIVLIRGDRALIDPYLIDLLIKKYLDERPDYCCNNLKQTFPRGMTTEIVSTDLLGSIALNNNDPYIREHVTLDFYENPQRYRIVNVEAPPEWYMPDLRLVLDTQEDLTLIQSIYEELYPLNPYFGLKEIINLIKAKPYLKEINSHIRQKGARE